MLFVVTALILGLTVQVVCANAQESKQVRADAFPAIKSQVSKPYTPCGTIMCAW